jgi:hypothetical protein
MENACENNLDLLRLGGKFSKYRDPEVEEI